MSRLKWIAYHCYDLEGLPRSNLGVEALFGEGRRQQRVLLEQFQQVPTWIYRVARQCVEAMETSVRWPRQLHRNATKALQKLDAATASLRQQVASPPDPAPIPP